MCLTQPVKCPLGEHDTSKENIGAGESPLVCPDTAGPQSSLCWVFLCESEQTASCPPRGSPGRPASRGPEDPQLQQTVHVRETWVFKRLEEGVGFAGKICSDCEEAADGDPLDQSYLLGYLPPLIQPVCGLNSAYFRASGKSACILHSYLSSSPSHLTTVACQRCC